LAAFFGAASGIEGETGARLVSAPFWAKMAKPFKTAGEVVKLADLLDEAEERAFNVVSKKNKERPESERLPESELPKIAPVVGLARPNMPISCRIAKAITSLVGIKCWRCKATRGLSLYLTPASAAIFRTGMWNPPRWGASARAVLLTEPQETRTRSNISSTSA